MRLENEKLRIEFLPELGGKIISFYLKGAEFELAAQNSNENRLEKKLDDTDFDGKITDDTDFGAYAFGMDDCFPCVNEEGVQWNGQTYSYLNHGDIWRNPMQCKELKPKEAYELFYRNEKIKYTYTKQISLLEHGVRLQYRIHNYGSKEFPCIWTWHGLMRYEEDMRVQLPGENPKIRNVFESLDLGKDGKIYAEGQKEYDFTRVPKRGSMSMLKYYIEDRVTEGTCGFYYPRSKVWMTMNYDKEMLPYLGVWITAGGLGGDYNCALEPCNGFYDSISCAKKNEKLKVLKPDETIAFSLEIVCKEN